VNAFVKGLNDAGFIEGRNVTIEYRWAGGHYDLLPSLAAELLDRDVALACLDAPSAAAAKAATKTIPLLVPSDNFEIYLAERQAKPVRYRAPTFSFLRRNCKP
jgi:ABC-type uncharacterized transport system substrate-binding protein